MKLGDVMPEIRLSDYVYEVVKAISLLAVTGLSWKVAVWVLSIIGL